MTHADYHPCSEGSGRDKMAAAGEDLAFARDVLRRQGAAARCSPEELDEALRAVAAVLLANGWVTDLRDAEGDEA